MANSVPSWEARNSVRVWVVFILSSEYAFKIRSGHFKRETEQLFRPAFFESHEPLIPKLRIKVAPQNYEVIASQLTIRKWNDPAHPRLDVNSRVKRRLQLTNSTLRNHGILSSPVSSCVFQSPSRSPSGASSWGSSGVVLTGQSLSGRLHVPTLDLERRQGISLSRQPWSWPPIQFSTLSHPGNHSCWFS